MAQKRVQVPSLARISIGGAVSMVFDKLLPASGVISESTGEMTGRTYRAQVLPPTEHVSVKPVQFLDLSRRF